MQRYKLLLTTEELKTLQNLCEDFLTDYHSTNEIVRDILTKVIVTQVEAEEPVDYHRNQSEADTNQQSWLYPGRS